MELPYDLIHSTSGVCREGTETRRGGTTYPLTFGASWSATAKTDTASAPTAHEQIKKTGHIHGGVLFGHKKEVT